jgi:hypothetical protein
MRLDRKGLRLDSIIDFYLESLPKLKLEKA